MMVSRTSSLALLDTDGDGIEMWAGTLNRSACCLPRHCAADLPGSLWRQQSRHIQEVSRDQSEHQPHRIQRAQP
jgi:hypothetical protein